MPKKQKNKKTKQKKKNKNEKSNVMRRTKLHRFLKNKDREKNNENRM